MDPRLLRYYNRELQHLREMGGEFAREFPKIAGRLGLEKMECADPYVERLIEGYAFLAARVQLKLDAEFPRFTQHLLKSVYPHYLAPTPSMAVVRFVPDLTEGSLGEGFTIPRGTALRSQLGKGEQTACEYRTAHALTLWPLELLQAKYFTYAGDLAGIPNQVKAGLRLRLRTTAGLRFDQLALDRLCVYLRGSGGLPTQLYEHLLANTVAVAAMPPGAPPAWVRVLPSACIRRIGFEEDQALLPYGPRSFQGYRLLHEYFAFPQRYLFIELTGLQGVVRSCAQSEIDLVVLFDRNEASLESAVDADDFTLFATPAINLFPRRADRIHLSDREHEYHVVPDRTRPMDFEIYDVTQVLGYGTSAEQEQEFLPLYARGDTMGREPRAYYTLRRAPRLLSERQRRQGPRASYTGSEVFVAIVDEQEAPYPSGLKQLGISALCTNRDLALSMPLGIGKTDFTLDRGGPVDAIRCLSGPTRPMPAHPEGDTAWRLISHLALNYLSITDTDERQGAAGLRELLRLYSPLGEPPLQKQIEGIKSVTSRPITRRMPTPGPITFGRGLEVTVSCDEMAFEGSGVFLLGAVLEQFFTKYASINSFTETVIRTPSGGEIMRWPATTGLRHLL